MIRSAELASVGHENKDRGVELGVSSIEGVRRRYGIDEHVTNEEVNARIEDIRQELETYGPEQDKHTPYWRIMMNNFSLHLYPLSSEALQKGRSDYRSVAYKGWWNRPYKEYLAEASDDEKRFNNHSPLFENQTGEQFYMVVDEVVKRVAQKSFGSSEIHPKMLDEMPKKDLYEHLLPAYVELRMKGYNHADLAV